MIDQTCDQTETRLAAREQDTLDLADLIELERHLVDCDDCCALARALDDGDAIAPVFPVVDGDVYDVGPVIGHGGMGQIRVAHDRRIGRRVALKELLFNTESLTARFVREARVAAGLQHPNIVPVYDVGCWDNGTPFYTMRLIEGRTLHTALADARSLEERLQLLPAVIAASDAAAFAHATGVVHRDLTPANILLGDFGETIVIDWGLAKHVRPSAQRVAPIFQTGSTHKLLTVQGSVLGSPGYMPPEQAAGMATDARADVYALGAVLYHLLAGRAPYPGKTSKDVLAKVRAGPPTPVQNVALGAPRALVAIVQRAMARDPAQRFENARELAGQLRWFEGTTLAGTSSRGWLARWLA